jgi:hypothetical protein
MPLALLKVKDSFSLNITLPANVNATVHVPVLNETTAVRACSSARAGGPSYKLGGVWFVPFDVSYTEFCSFLAPM